ncbi:MAG: nuclear transport factor 2 family protein [Woeseiaceae bacterium]|jgi:ketosteroid isomerase-like protein|nr:nuclear transport factor 2 family protein [Woeseiaceae bacterium]
MTKLKTLSIYNLIAVIGLFATATVQADDMDDVAALVNAYIETESDLNAQSKLMSEDRIYIVGSPAMRMTDNEVNMMGQAFGEKRREAMDSKSLYFATIEDQIIRMYGEAAVASFRRNLNFRPSADGMKNGMSNNTARQLVTVVMAKVDGDWKIVHTHISPA